MHAVGDVLQADGQAPPDPATEPVTVRATLLKVRPELGRTKTKFHRQEGIEAQQDGLPGAKNKRRLDCSIVGARGRAMTYRWGAARERQKARRPRGSREGAGGDGDEAGTPRGSEVHGILWTCSLAQHHAAWMKH